MTDWLISSVAVLLVLAWLAAVTSLGIVACDIWKPWWLRIPAGVAAVLLFVSVMGFMTMTMGRSA